MSRSSPFSGENVNSVSNYQYFIQTFNYSIDILSVLIIVVVVETVLKVLLRIFFIRNIFYLIRLKWA